MLTGVQSIALDHLPGADDPLFHHLLRERRLRFGHSVLEPDVIDELSTRLVCAALASRQRLLLVLPDSRPYRPALLLTIALLRHWLDTRGAVASVGGAAGLTSGGAPGDERRGARSAERAYAERT